MGKPQGPAARARDTLGAQDTGPVYALRGARNAIFVGYAWAEVDSMVQQVRPRTLKKFPSLRAAVEARWIPGPRSPEIISRGTHGTSPLAPRGGQPEAFGGRSGDPAVQESTGASGQAQSARWGSGGGNTPEFPCVVDIPPSYVPTQGENTLSTAPDPATNAGSGEPAPSLPAAGAKDAESPAPTRVPAGQIPRLPLPSNPFELIHLPAAKWLADLAPPCGQFSFPEEEREPAGSAMEGYLKSVARAQAVYSSRPQRLPFPARDNPEPTHVAFVDGGCSGTRGGLGGFGTVVFDLQALRAFLEAAAGGGGAGRPAVGAQLGGPGDGQPQVPLANNPHLPTLPPTPNPFLEGAVPPPGHALWALCPVKKYHRAYANTTNNRMELRAIVCALANVPRGARLHVYSDSRYCVDTATRFLPSWLRSGRLDPRDRGAAALRAALAREPKEAPPLNKDQMYYLAHYLGLVDARFFHVRGHSNVHYNEMADRLTWLGRSAGACGSVDVGCYGV